MQCPVFIMKATQESLTILHHLGTIKYAMLPAPQNFASTSSSAPAPSGYPSLSGPVAFSSQPSFLPQTVQDHSLHQGADPNSPEVFKQHIFLIRDNVAQLQNLARSALTGMCVMTGTYELHLSADKISQSKRVPYRK